MSLFRPQFWKIPETNDAERRRLPELAAAWSAVCKTLPRAIRKPCSHPALRLKIWSLPMPFAV